MTIRKRSILLKSIRENNLIIRKNELCGMLNNMGINPNFFINHGLCYNYINYGEGTIDTICNKIEMDLFLEKHTNYHILIANYERSVKKYPWSVYNLSTIEIEKIEYEALKEYIIQNIDNIHKILKEIPWTLKKKVDLIYCEINLL